DHAEFLSTMDRLVAFAADRRVTHVLGCHVEMTKRSGRDYPLGATYQPNERALEFTTAHLTAIRDAAKEAKSGRRVVRFADFILYIEQGRRGRRAVRAGGQAKKILPRVVRGRRHPVAIPAADPGAHTDCPAPPLPAATAEQTCREHRSRNCGCCY